MLRWVGWRRVGLGLGFIGLVGVDRVGVRVDRWVLGGVGSDWVCGE